jgi:hypothetical protein
MIFSSTSHITRYTTSFDITTPSRKKRLPFLLCTCPKTGRLIHRDTASTRSFVRTDPFRPSIHAIPCRAIMGPISHRH